MYPEDSIICCLFPQKCNMFQRTPVIIFWESMWYLNMTIITCVIILVVWSIARWYAKLQHDICRLISIKKEVASGEETAAGGEDDGKEIAAHRSPVEPSPSNYNSSNSEATSESCSTGTSAADEISEKFTLAMNMGASSLSVGGGRETNAAAQNAGNSSSGSGRCCSASDGFVSTETGCSARPSASPRDAAANRTGASTTSRESMVDVMSMNGKTATRPGRDDGRAIRGKQDNACDSLLSLKNKPCSSRHKTQQVNNKVNNLMIGESSKIIARGNPRDRINDDNFDGDDEDEEDENDCCDINLVDPNCSKKEKICMNKHEIEFCLKFEDKMYHPTITADQFLDMIKKKP